MLYLVLSIICSVSVGVIFKTARRHDTRATQIVAWNYVIAIILCYLFFNPDFSEVTSSAPWHIYIPLSVLMPFIFLFLAASIKHMGIVKTDAAQRLSLFIPIIASWLIFNEDFNLLKFVGLAIGFPAIWLIFRRKDETQGKKWQYPAIVLVGFGVVDVLFKSIALQTKIPFTTSLFIVFCGALVVATGIVAYYFIKLNARFSFLNLAYGMLIGIFNFGNILFYLQAHKAFAENPSTVFAIMNIGVIVIGTFAGILVFKEKMNKLNYAGLFMAISAIIFITLSQVYN